MVDPLISRALESYEELQNVIDQLDSDQIKAILELESQTRQRKSYIKRCIRQLTKLYREGLQQKYLPPNPRPN